MISIYILYIYVYICHIICPWLNVQNLDHHAAMGDSGATGRGMLSVPCLWRRPGQKSQRARTARHVLFVDTVLHGTIKQLIILQILQLISCNL